MQKEKMFDALIIKSMQAKAGDVSAVPELKDRIDKKINSEQVYHTEEKMMRRNNIIKAVAAAVAVCIIIPGTVFAAGKVVSYTSSMNRTKDDADYADVGELQKKIGFDFKTTESFSNGYTFKSMNTDNVDKLDDKNNKTGSFAECTGIYAKEGCPELEICISEVQPETEEDAQRPQYSETVDGISIGYSKDRYKFVPADYEPTAEDKANESGGHYFISYDSEKDVKIEEQEFSHVEWREGGLDYSIQGFDTDMSAEEMVGMAKEVIESK
jgi:hypothetical protein